MQLTQKIEFWTETHHPAWLDLFRITVGLFLFRQGFIFLNDIWALQQYLNNINLNWDAYYLAHIIAYLHIIGGFFITIGLFTRLFIFSQIPILIAAVIYLWPDYNTAGLNQAGGNSILYVWSGTDTSHFSTEWWQALGSLILLLFCWIFNSGPWSVDHFLENYETT